MGDFKVLTKKLLLFFVFACTTIVKLCASSVDTEKQFKFMHLNLNDGMSSNEVHAILKDSQGFMWFGTAQGLNRFDGSTVKNYIHTIGDSTSIPFNNIDYLFEDYDQNLWIRSQQQFVVYNPFLESFSSPTENYKNTSISLNDLQSLYIDKENNTWLVCSNYGLYKYTNKDGNIDSIPFTTDIQSPINNNYLCSVKEDSSGNLWAVSNAGEILRINTKSYEIEQRFFLGNEISEQYNNFQLFVDSDNDVWIYSPGQSYGVFQLNNSTNNIQQITQNSPVFKLSNNMVSSVIESEDKQIWIATDHGGINIIDKSKQSVKVLTHNRNIHNSISQNSVTYLYRDNENIIWAGTFKQGINYFHKNLIRFDHYNYMDEVSSSLPYNDVNCFVEDKHGNLWIGTNGDGLIYFNRNKNTYKTYKHNPANKNSLSANVIVSLYIDRKGILWIGTYLGGLNSFDGFNFKRYKQQANTSNSLSDNRVWEIIEDSKQNLWIGTLNGGLNLFDREKEQFTHFKSEDGNSVNSNFIVSIIEDSEQNLWLGTSNGIDVYNLNTKQFKHFSPNPNQPGQLSDNNAIDIHEDGRGLIWIATTQGLNVFNKHENRFKVIAQNEGLPNANIKTIQEDEQGNIWVATLKGISKITINDFSSQQSIQDLNFRIDNFGIFDGLQGNEFNQKSAYRTRSGELIFGGANGFNLFNPKNINNIQAKEKIVISNLKIFNNDIAISSNDKGKTILKQSIVYQKNIQLRHNQNVFSIEFSAIDYFHPQKNRFQYRLENFNENWLDVNPGRNEITFTNLDAGTYELFIRGSNDQQNWIELSTPLTIEILPPYWKCNIAYFLYLLFIAGILFIVWRILAERQRLKFEAEQEHREAERMQQVDALKTNFFTNISHEIRTPLSLIIAPLDKIIKKTRNENQRNHLILIQRNARRMLAMVNQVLDFRKMELQKIEVHNSWGEMIGFIRDIGLNFEDLVASKQIDYQFSNNCDNLYTYFDQDKTDKIVTNLLSNAFKFTPYNGEVTLKIKLDKKSILPNLTLEVSDSGIGIHENQQQYIFDRFYQTGHAGEQLNPGSGIGLSMVKEYVTLMGGTVKVESIVERGSKLTVDLPVQLFTETEIKENNKKSNKVKHNSPDKKRTQIRTKEAKPFDNTKKTVAIVEDSTDFRFYLKENLVDNYNIFEAENGLKGWEIINSKLPDLVVSDVMMPEMDGVELCKKIKAHKNTKHIPVLLLTAKTETDPVIKGYKSGADGYISKPFDFAILESRIENLINTREQLRLTFQSMIGVNPEKAEIASEDEKFITDALKIVEDNLDESSFSVEEFGVKMGMSRVSLYKRLMALTNKSPIEFIRIIRLKRAADLLSNSQLPVSEIAYKVGFNHPRYFSKYFNKQYKMTPSEYISKHRQEKREISEEMKNRFR